MSDARRPDESLLRRRANLARLFEELAPVRDNLLSHAGIADAPHLSTGFENDDLPGPEAFELSALDILQQELGLTDADRLVLLLALGIQIDPAMSDAAAALSENGTIPRLTVEIATSVLRLPQAPGTRLVFSDLGALRRHEIIRLDTGANFQDAAILVDTCIITFLTELVYFDAALSSGLRPAASSSGPAASMSASVQALAQAVGDVRGATVWIAAASPGDAEQAFFNAMPHRSPMVYATSALPADPEEARVFGTRLNRHMVVLDAPVALEIDTRTAGAGHIHHTLPVFLRQIRDSVVCWPTGSDISGNEHAPIDAMALTAERPLVTISLSEPDAADRQRQWENAIAARLSRLVGPDRLEGIMQTDEVRLLSAEMSEEYRLDPHSILGAAQLIQPLAPLSADPVDGPDTSETNREPGNAALPALLDTRAMRQAAQSATRSRLSVLAEHIPATGSLDDLVLAPREKAKLKAIRDHMSNRRRVYREWKLDQVAGERGLGVSALFFGPSGTGKTFAGEKLAAEIGLELFRVDLSQMVSKWIGETEKNIGEVFEAAQGGGALLLFDEADSLFGKRGDAKDGGGHHMNATVGYLLQAMERHPGMMILTTNRFDAVDQAFLRRLNYVVDFPAPGTAERRLIWQRCLPASVMQDGIDFDLLAGLPLSGGQIRLVALHAAFRAASRPGPVTMADAAFAARLEYEKHGRSPSERLFQLVGTNDEVAR